MSLEVWLWGAAAIGSTVGLGYLGNRVMFARMRRRWRELASDLGLTFDEARWRVRGHRDDLYIEVARLEDGSWDATVLVRGTTPLPIGIRPRSFTERPRAAVFGSDFDPHFIVTGSEIHALALLGAELRQAWLFGLVRRWTLEGDEDGWVLEARFNMEITSLVRPIVGEGLAFGRKLADATRSFTRDPLGDVFAHALIARLSDPSPEVRASAAEKLAHYLVSVKEVGEALTQALSDPEPAVRLQAALVLGRADALAEIAVDPRASTATHLTAFRRAVALAPKAASTVALVRAWALDPDVGRRLEAIAVTPLTTSDPEAWGLEVLTEAERHPDEVTLLALFVLLAKHGTTRSVPRLAPYRDRFLGSALKAAARDAILAIQARTGGSTGALSIAQGGELSEPE